MGKGLGTGSPPSKCLTSGPSTWWLADSQSPSQNRPCSWSWWQGWVDPSVPWWRLLVCPVALEMPSSQTKGTERVYRNSRDWTRTSQPLPSPSLLRPITHTLCVCRQNSVSIKELSEIFFLYPRRKALLWNTLSPAPVPATAISLPDMSTAAQMSTFW